ncbi:MAG: 16S rRNA (guanine(966)-N(2))-methyltransferase RsmD [Rhizomicrobium sp.]
MRITGGQFRGRNLAEPPDNRVRPTSDKVRQAVFNILAHNDFGFALDGAKVVDLFAGTGALGLEALSRGALFALFVDDSAESRALIRANVEALNLTGATKIWRRDARDLGPLGAGAGGPFTLAFLDAPYRKNLTAPALQSLRGGWLASEAIVVAETGEDETLDAEGYRLLDRRSYGETAIHILAASSG